MGLTPVLIATTEFKRTFRVVAADRTKIAVWGVMWLAIVGSLGVVGFAFLPDIGDQVAAGNLVDIPGLSLIEGIAGGMAVAWVFFVIFATVRTVESTAYVDQPATLLISTSVRNAVIGKAGASLLLFAFWFLPPIILMSALFAYGTGSPLPVVFTILAVGIVMVTGIPVGYVLGVCVRHLLTVYEPIARFRTPLLIAIAVGYTAAAFMGWINEVTVWLFEALGGSPLGWPGHLLALGIPHVTPSTTAVIGAIVGTFVLVPVAMYLSIELAGRLWFADPARPRDDSSAEDDAGTPNESASRLGRFVPASVVTYLTNLFNTTLDQPVRVVVGTTIRRTIRAPIRLMYVVFPVFGLLFFMEPVLRSGEIPAYLPVVLCLYVIWGAGALFALNIFGDFGGALPVVITSTVSGRQMITGVVIASALIAVPIGVIVSVSTGLVSPLDPEQTLALLGATVVGSVASPILAAGVGSLFPRFGSVRVMGKRRAVMPSKTAFVVYSIGIMLPTLSGAILYFDDAPAGVATGLSALIGLLPRLDLSITIQPESVILASWIILFGGLLGPIAAYWYASRRFSEFTIG